jgi:hypothetical protein
VAGKALLPLLEQVGDRAMALRWHDDWRRRLEQLGRCSLADGRSHAPSAAPTGRARSTPGTTTSRAPHHPSERQSIHGTDATPLG